MPDAGEFLSLRWNSEIPEIHMQLGNNVAREMMPGPDPASAADPLMASRAVNEPIAESCLFIGDSAGVVTESAVHAACRRKLFPVSVIPEV